MRLLEVAIVAALALCAAACDRLEAFNDTADQAVAVIDQGIEDIRAESTAWRSVLQRVADELPAEVGELIRNDAQNLVSRSVATTGVEFRCNSDFLAHRAASALGRLKAKVLGQTPPPLPPAFCQVTPDAIDLKVDPASWSKLVLSGYDLDHKDADGNYFAMEFVGADGKTTLIGNQRIGRTTHYQATVNLGEFARQLHADGVSKIRVNWGRHHDGYPQVVVLPWEPARRTVKVGVGNTTWHPQHQKGDKDFYLHKKGRYARVKLHGELTLDRHRRKLLSRVYMNAKELHRDHTEASGWSPVQTAYTAPLGWRIESASPSGTSSADVRVHGRDASAGRSYRRANGEPVQRFTIWVDRKGDDIGNYTRVEARWNPVSVSLVQEQPEWMR